MILGDSTFQFVHVVGLLCFRILKHGLHSFQFGLCLSKLLFQCLYIGFFPSWLRGCGCLRVTGFSFGFFPCQCLLHQSGFCGSLVHCFSVGGGPFSLRFFVGLSFGSGLGALLATQLFLLLLALKPLLSCLKTLACTVCLELLRPLHANLAFGVTVILHERNGTWANIRAGATFDAVEEV